MLAKIRFILHVTRAHGIVRRYFVINGFDGALTMLGMMLGFYLGGGVALQVAISACLGAAIALGMSGLSSAYISEAAEKKKELHEIEEAMVANLGETELGEASRIAPLVIAVVNGLAPLVMSLLIIAPLFFAYYQLWFPLEPFVSSIFLSFVVIFMLGVFLGRVGGEFWLFTGIRALGVALLTAMIIILIEI